MTTLLDARNVSKTYPGANGSTVKAVTDLVSSLADGIRSARRVVAE